MVVSRAITCIYHNKINNNQVYTPYLTQPSRTGQYWLHGGTLSCCGAQALTPPNKTVWISIVLKSLFRARILLQACFYSKLRSGPELFKKHITCIDMYETSWTISVTYNSRYLHLSMPCKDIHANSELCHIRICFPCWDRFHYWK